MPAVRRIGLGLIAAVAVVLALPAPAPALARTVHLRGTAYEFNRVEVRLAGATIGVAERPALHATTRPDGTYDLAVPDRAEITPFIEAPGYRTIHLQTFRTSGEDLANVNFQTPTEGVAQALATLLGIPLDASGRPRDCVIVSTFSTRNVRDLGFAGFIGYGAHGVAGATAQAGPALPGPVYFNEDVLPDPAQRQSSKDGGVIWTGVPPGRYTLTAHHPSTRFASFVATCAPGRIVNANPPWGLHELGRVNPSVLRATWRTPAGAAPVLRSLRARHLPRHARVRVRCLGRGCRLGTRTVRPSGRSVDVARALGRRARRLRAGQTLEVGVFAHAYDGRVVRWALHAGRRPRPAKRCVPLGFTLARRTCSPPTR